jgi:hypothetical protein
MNSEALTLTRACIELAKAAQMVKPFEPKIATELSARFTRFRRRKFADNEGFAGSLSELRDALMTLAGVIRHYEIDDSGSTTDQLVDETLNIVDEFEKREGRLGSSRRGSKEN